MKKALFNKGSSPRDVVGDLPHIKSFIHKESSLFNKGKSAEDCRVLRTATSAMTTFFNEKAFTLIELLVVVLIIGILSAIALPQYTLAVEKARATEALQALQAVSKATDVYYLANGSYTGMTQDNLDVTLPTLSYSTFSMGVYAANHMDLIFDAIKGNYELVGVHLDGKQLRIYCWAGTDQAVKICKALGAASTCQKDRQCDLTI